MKHYSANKGFVTLWSNQGSNETSKCPKCTCVVGIISLSSLNQFFKTNWRYGTVLCRRDCHKVFRHVSLAVLYQHRWSKKTTTQCQRWCITWFLFGSRQFWVCSLKRTHVVINFRRRLLILFSVVDLWPYGQREPPILRWARRSPKAFCERYKPAFASRRLPGGLCRVVAVLSCAYLHNTCLMEVNHCCSKESFRKNKSFENFTSLNNRSGENWEKSQLVWHARSVCLQICIKWFLSLWSCLALALRDRCDSLSVGSWMV